MGRIVPLNASGQAVADANGEATVRIYAPPGAVAWTITRMITSVTGAGITSNTLVQHAVYTNVIAESNKRDFTTSAQDTSETNIPLQSSESIIATYSGIPVGGICTFTVTGTVDTGR